MVDIDKNLCVENPANASMHNSRRIDVGVIVPPDFSPVKNFYSYHDGNALYNRLDYDTCELQKHVTSNKGKFPPVLKVLGSLIGTGALIFGGIKGVKHLLHKIKL